MRENCYYDWKEELVIVVMDIGVYSFIVKFSVWEWDVLVWV